MFERSQLFDMFVCTSPSRYGVFGTETQFSVLFHYFTLSIAVERKIH